jgi:hypothetical protein
MAVESGMTQIAEFDRSQLILLPEAVDDYVDADNPVRFIDAFVAGLDLAAMGFARATPACNMRGPRLQLIFRAGAAYPPQPGPDKRFGVWLLDICSPLCLG